MKDLKELRLAKKLSQVAVARACGVSLMTYQIWEKEVGNPNQENLAKLKKALGIE